MKNVSAVLLLLLLVTIPSVMANWDYNPVPKPAQDISALLVPLPKAIGDQYGHTDRTLVMYNLFLQRRVNDEVAKAFNGLEKQVKQLEAEVKKLTAPIAEPIADPNEAGKEVTADEN
jgi:hypothetical protein